MWWYGKPELIVMAAIALVWLISCLHRNVFTLLAGTTMFLALSGIVSFDPFFSPYLKDVFAEAGFIFPNTFETITNSDRVRGTNSGKCRRLDRNGHCLPDRPCPLPDK